MPFEGWIWTLTPCYVDEVSQVRDSGIMCLKILIDAICLSAIRGLDLDPHPLLCRLNVAVVEKWNSCLCIHCSIQFVLMPFEGSICTLPPHYVDEVSRRCEVAGLVCLQILLHPNRFDAIRRLNLDPYPSLCRLKLAGVKY